MAMRPVCKPYQVRSNSPTTVAVGSNLLAAHARLEHAINAVIVSSFIASDGRGEITIP